MPPSLPIYCSLYIQLFQVAVCDYEFGVKLHTVQCCDGSGCEEELECLDHFFFLCFRRPNWPHQDRQSCQFFISANGSKIIDRELTTADITNLSVRH